MSKSPYDLHFMADTTSGGPDTVTVLSAAHPENVVAALTWELRDGRLVLVDLHLFELGADAAIGTPVRPPGVEVGAGIVNTAHGIPTMRDRQPCVGITLRLLRELNIGALEAAARMYLAQASSEMLRRQLGEEWSEAAAARPGRRGRPPEWYADFAREYDELVNRQGSRKPIDDLAARRQMDRTQVRNIIYKCRERGLLTGSGQGSSSGKLTAKARKILRDAQ